MEKTYGSLALALTLALGASACDGGDNGTDAGPVDTDAGPMECVPPDPITLPEGTPPAEVTCPTVAPNPEELGGICCHRLTNEDRLDRPEMRLTYVDIGAPRGSNLTQRTVRNILVEAMEDERFNWLVRAEIEGSDVTLVTGFGRRAADGTYNFSEGAASGDPDTFRPVSIEGTIDGETITTGPMAGSLTVPVLDEDGEEVTVELTLRDVAIPEANLGVMRSCIGWKGTRAGEYHPAGLLTAFIEVEGSLGAVVEVPPIETTICSAIAGNLGNPNYCTENDQGDWNVPPDSLCTAEGCQQNTPCETDVCDPATTCNAWRLEARFAAAAIEISN